MTTDETLITKFLLLDTNILFSFIEAVGKDANKYSELLTDLETFANYKKYNIYISDSIKKELSTIFEIKEFDRIFQEKREESARINFFKIKFDPVLVKILQPLFKGNLNEYTGLREAETADHTLIINAVELLKNRGNKSLQTVIYSNDHEVQEVTKKLSTILPIQYNYTAPYISWMAGFQLIIEMLFYKKILHLYSDLETVLDFTIKNYYDRRRLNDYNYHITDLFQNSLKSLIAESESLNIRNSTLEKKNFELQKEFGEYQGNFQEYQKAYENEQISEEQLHKAISLIEEGNVEEAILTLQNLEVRNYGPVLRTYYRIVIKQEKKLHQYYRDWNKVLKNKKTYINRGIEKQLDKNVFLTFVQREIDLFKFNNLEEARNLSMELIPLLAAVQWDINEENKKLEQYYIMSMYLALARDDINEFKEIADVLQLAIDEKSCENEQIKNYVAFSKLILNPKENYELKQQFKSQILQNITEFYLTRNWNLVWNLLLPIWECLTKNEKDSMIEYLVNTYWVTLEPPERLSELWEEINQKEQINANKNLLGNGLMDSEIAKFRGENLPEFLKGEHFVIDTKMVGRAHIIIHVKLKNSRFGVQISSDELDLSDAQTLEFTDGCISQYFKGTYPDERKNNICGIIKIKKEANLKTRKRKNTLDNFIL